MFRFVKVIALEIFCLLESAQKYYMSSLPAILTLRNAWDYISTPNSGNVAFYVKTSVNSFFSLTATLDILYIDPNNSHVQSGEYLDDARPRG